MNETLAWVAACAGLTLGGVAAFVPGFPGAAVALLGLLSFAALTDFQWLTRDALVFGALIVVLSAGAQVSAPAIASRAAGGSAGAATGAAVGAVLGALVPLPSAPLVGGVLGAAVLGVVFSRKGVVKALRGILGAGGGCAVAVAVDLIAVLALGALLAVAVFAARLPAP